MAKRLLSVVLSLILNNKVNILSNFMHNLQKSRNIELITLFSYFFSNYIIP